MEISRTDATPLNLFLVEDSELIRLKLRTLLSSVPGFAVRGEAETAREAIDAITTSAPDVVLLDLNLREGHGSEVLKAVKAALPEIIVIIMSVNPFAEFGAHFLAEGADHYLEKHTSPDVLLNLLNKIRLPYE